MEDKIEVGEYIRTIDGTIAKIEDDEFDLRYGCFGSIQPFYRYFKNKEQITESIVKHSKNIIDLIGEGDYVNGKYVYSVGTAMGNLPIINHTDGTFTPSNMIKSIVTKESFASVEYKI